MTDCFTLGRFGVAVALVLPGLVACPGCRGAKTITVRGNVTFNGAPVAEGGISFAPAEGQGVGMGGTIKDGQYEVVSRPGVQPGPMVVKIVALRPDPQAGGGKPTLVQYIPARYNEESTLTADISKGENTKDFDLQGDQK